MIRFLNGCSDGLGGGEAGADEEEGLLLAAGLPLDCEGRLPPDLLFPLSRLLLPFLLLPFPLVLPFPLPRFLPRVLPLDLPSG